MLTLAENTSHIIAAWTRPAFPNGNLMYNLSLTSTNQLTGGLTIVAADVIVTDTMFTYGIILEFFTTYEVTVVPFTGAGPGNGLMDSFTTQQGRTYILMG